ncbi:MAG: glycosyltransferase family 4 protein [Acidobacteriota bacterium]
MRVALVSDHFPPNAVGGAEWSISALVDLLAPHTERLLVLVAADSVEKEETRGSVRIVRFRPPFLPATANSQHRARALSNPWFTLRTVVRLRRLLREEKIELVHAQSHGVLPAAYIAAHRLGVPAVATLRDTRTLCEPAICLHEHAHVPSDCGHAKLRRECVDRFLDATHAPTGRLSRLRRKAHFSWLWADNRPRWWCLRRCDAVIGVSQAILDLYRHRGLLDAERSRLVSIPTPPPTPPADAAARRKRTRARLGLGEAPTVLYLGKHSPGKGTETLRRAWRQAVARFPDARLLLAGAGHPPEDAPGLRVLGPVPHEEAMDLTLAADLVVSPSIGPEALSRSLVEAAGLGVPVIGTRTGGTAEIVRDGLTGLLVERGDSAALASALEALLCDPAARARLAAGQRQLVSGTLSAASIRGAHLDLYRELLRESSGAEGN